MSAFKVGREIERLDTRVAKLERTLQRKRLARGTNSVVVLPAPLGMDAPFRVDPELEIDPVWGTPFTTPISAELNRGGARVNDIAISPVIDAASGRMQIVLTDSTNNVDDDDDGYKYHGCWFEISFLTPFSGPVYANAEFMVEASTLSHDVIDEFGVSAVYAYALQKHFIQAWIKTDGVFREFGYGGDGYQNKLWQVTDGRDHRYNENRSNLPVSIRMTTIPVAGNTRIYLQVGIQSGVSFSTNDYSISTLSTFTSRLVRVTAGIVI